MRGARLVAPLAVAAAFAAVGGRAAIGEPTANKLAFTRPDGSRIDMARAVRAWCGRWDSRTALQTLHVMAGVRTRAGTKPFWRLDAVVRDVQRRPTVRFPHEVLEGKPSRAILFAFDAKRKKNELSSADEQARGSMRFRPFTCKKGTAIGFSIDATLGSEFFRSPSIKVRGRLSAAIS